MSTQTLAFILFCTVGLLVAGMLAGYPYWVARRRQKWRAQPFPARWRKILQKRVPLFRRLPTDLQLQLKRQMQVFLAEKTFIGCAGLRITDEMRVVIAAQACLLILNRGSTYFHKLRQILVYPGAFAVNRVHTDDLGVQQEERQALSGESWAQGQVILSWQDCLHGAAIPDDGQNVTIHEFAHQLDQENGVANGAPPRRRSEVAADPARWSTVFQAAFDRLRFEAHSHSQGLLNHYGAKDPAEFFAVVSEVFFERPAALQLDYPALYTELRHYYQLDPATWACAHPA